jgi:sugar phosphate isomerase/epimerase
LWGQQTLSLEAFLRQAAKMGYAGVELMGKAPHLSPLDWTPARAKKLRALAAAEGLEVCCVAAYTDFSAGLDTPDIPLLEMQVHQVEALARLAEALGCRLVRVFTSYEREGVPLARQWERAVDGLRQCCDRCRAYGVTVGIQNHHDLAVHSKALAELWREIDRPNCKLMLDPWSPCLRGEEPFETARKLAPQVVYTTLADYIRLPRFKYQPALVNYRALAEDLVRAVPMGEGELNSLAFVRGLKAGGYRGPIAYEMCSPLRGGGAAANLERCARAFLAWLEQNQI